MRIAGSFATGTAGHQFKILGVIGTCYSKRNADKIAWQLLGNTRVRAAAEADKAKQLAKAEVNASRVLEELRRIALFDPAAPSCFWSE